MKDDELIALTEDYKSISLVGICKNAGKTTVLNRLISVYKHEIIGLTSIGRDGEPFDVSTGAEKPRIFVTEGTLIATAGGCVCDVTKEMLCTTGIITPLGEVVIFRATTDGFVELAGAPDITGTARVKDKLFTCGAVRVFIDGAANRRAGSAYTASDGVVLCTSAEYDSDINRVAEETYRFVKLMTIPRLPEAEKDGVAEWTGLFTDTEAQKIIGDKDNHCKAIVFDDTSSVFLSLRQLERLENRVKLYVRNSNEMLFISVNPYSARGYSFDGKLFKKIIMEKTGIPTVDVKEQ